MNHRTKRVSLALGACAIWVGATVASCSSDDAGKPGAGGSSPAGGSGSGGASGFGGSGGSGPTRGAGGSSTGGDSDGGSTSAGGSSGGVGGGAGGSAAGGASGGAGAGVDAGSGGGAGGGGPRPDAGAAGGALGSDASRISDGGSSAVAFEPPRAVVTGMRGVAAPPAAYTVQLHNGGQAAAQVSALALSGMNAALFRIAPPAALPATIMPGGNLAVTLQMDTGNTLPPLAANTDTGSTFLTATLTATTSVGAIASPVFGLVMSTNAAGSALEPTLGQILTTLGYSLNVGMAQNNWNPNRGNTAVDLPRVEAGTDEVAAPLFVRAGAGNVTLVPVARFSPQGEMPFGWYPPNTPTMRTRVAAMAGITDPQTTDKARMVYPPLVAPATTSFDPGAAPFGIWVFSGQAATTTNGDYNYSQDALNVPTPGVHRFKAYPFKDAAGPVANTYLLAVEEASNGDYQDYVFILSNVRVAP
jgi:hypothetical protein